jgi:hypothetical protein
MPDSRSLLTLDLVLRAWLLFGAAMLIALPSARGMHPLVGWLPFWLLVWPLASWLLLHRRRPEAAFAARRPRARARAPGSRRRAALPAQRALLAALRLP